MSSAISITKECVPGTTLVDIGNNVVVEAGVSGQVTNNGQSRLTGITLAHNPAATVTLASSTLNPGESTSWSATYQPAAITSGDGTIPGRYFFDDTIRVTAATPAVGPSPSPVGGCRTPMICPAPAPAARSARQVRAPLRRSGLINSVEKSPRSAVWRLFVSRALTIHHSLKSPACSCVSITLPARYRKSAMTKKAIPINAVFQKRSVRSKAYPAAAASKYPKRAQKYRCAPQKVTKL